MATGQELNHVWWAIINTAETHDQLGILFGIAQFHDLILKKQIFWFDQPNGLSLLATWSTSLVKWLVIGPNCVKKTSTQPQTSVVRSSSLACLIKALLFYSSLSNFSHFLSLSRIISSPVHNKRAKFAYLKLLQLFFCVGTRLSWNFLSPFQKFPTTFLSWKMPQPNSLSSSRKLLRQKPPGKCVSFRVTSYTLLLSKLDDWKELQPAVN